MNNHLIHQKKAESIDILGIHDKLYKKGELFLK